MRSLKHQFLPVMDFIEQLQKVPANNNIWHYQKLKDRYKIKGFQTECCTTKTKVITTAIQKRRKTPFKASENSKLIWPNCLMRRKTRATKSWLFYSFTSNYLRGWHKFSRPIKDQSEAKQKLSQISLYTQLKIAIM